VRQGPGRGQKTLAFQQAAKALSKPEADIRDVYSNYRNYILLLKSNRPGSLLQVGKGVDTM
jgi:hypothetical protein